MSRHPLSGASPEKSPAVGQERERIAMTLFDRSMIHLYTGNGKGKTTAALGIVLRAVGHGARCGVVQFLKGWDFYGEIAGLGLLPGVTLVRTGRAEYVHKSDPWPEDFSEALRGLEVATTWLHDGLHDLVVMDELNVALDFGLVPEESVLFALTNRLPSVEVVITGRGAPKSIQELADIVTHMEEIRHPYQSGILAQKGREY